MNSPFPHTYFLASALVLAIGGLAMMAAIISGDHAAIDRLLDAYITAFSTGGGVADRLRRASPHQGLTVMFGISQYPRPPASLPP
jgi:hypothetical protein